MDWIDMKCYTERVKGIHNHITKDVMGLVIATLDKITPRPGQPFVIGDYGTSDGGISYQLIRKCIEFLRNKYGKELPIQIIYEDHPMNDFKPIFLRTNGLLQGETGLTEEFPNVFVLVSGTSFYQQCLPPESIDFIFTSLASHWLSRSPGTLTDAILANNGTGSEREAYAKQAAEDWETFLLHRATELVPGGYLIDINAILDGICEQEHPVKHSVKELFVEMANIWKDLSEEGIISQDEFKNINFRAYMRSTEEVRRPFQDTNSAVEKAGLRFDSLSIKVIDDPFHAMLECERGNKDDTPSRKVVEKYVKCRRSVSETTFMQGLASHRSDEEKRGILDKYFQRFLERILENPDKHGFNMEVAHMAVHKVTVTDSN